MTTMTRRHSRWHTTNRLAGLILGTLAVTAVVAGIILGIHAIQDFTTTFATLSDQ